MMMMSEDDDNNNNVANNSDSSDESTTTTTNNSINNHKKIDLILKDIHESSFPFRIVVIGNGAILETTSILGPHMATSTSTKTGERLVTLASADKSFEFHVKVDQVSKVTFTEREKPGSSTTNNIMRICRLQSKDEKPICSLILADSSEDAKEWFQGMTLQYGHEVLLMD
eukprot:CAMPEP_0197829090 /NCGR_PEP_ID=MMETSP1437-20131217/5561_1 /TAXON_ID=49252 ORGANISM="Eucampia antarctica, Strain CCMP1452" /NCGR_SAMPLE_ID=MMETSP1437 /ASSEMBLY_ACC=CAM_ASM_001096 /LENGTH=169 /DNA_ID=CAMNT_0043430585 /DNA_START=207 /DNA_END=716 /DNA_ORIENTATION=-